MVLSGDENIRFLDVFANFSVSRSQICFSKYLDNISRFLILVL